jgi:hypothetical protein
MLWFPQWVMTVEIAHPHYVLWFCALFAFSDVLRLPCVALHGHVPFEKY